MRTFRLTKIHLILIGFILCGLIAICAKVSQSEVVFLLVTFLSIGLLIALLIYQDSHFQLTEVEKIELLNHQTEDSLKKLLDKMPVGVVRFDKNSKEISWFNPYAELVFTRDSGNVDLEMMKAIIAKKEKNLAESSVHIFGNQYLVYLDDTAEICYFFDMVAPMREVEFQSVIGLISVDNYDEMTDDLSDAQISQINSFVADFIAKFAHDKKMFYRRLSSDRFFFFTDYKVLQELIEDKFRILEDFRKTSQEKDLSLTLSIGAAYGMGDYDQIGVLANQNLNMALMRGGDQAVVKENTDHQKLMYFGGGTASTVKRSRTRTRAMMTAISDKIKMADQIFIVGHKNLDMDALGAAVGMQHFSAVLQRRAYVVYEKLNPSKDIERALTRLREDGQTALVTADEALYMMTERSLLVMVDHSKLSLTLSRELYDQFAEVVIVDHHRRDQDFPDKASLTFIESGASSACELVTELIQFQSAKTRLSKVQASVIMAGIMLDTKNFSTRVTSRTFDVASYLRTVGSDSTEIQSISATSFEDYRLVNQLIVRGEKLYDNLIIASGLEDVTYSKVIASKAADTLLNMADIDASFVIVRVAEDEVAISARSHQSVNVQRIMEDMGGGGHYNLAACQLTKLTVAEAHDLLVDTIIKNYSKES